MGIWSGTRTIASLSASRNPASYALVARAVFILAALHIGGLLVIGRPAFCACGSVKFWQGSIFSPETSQQIADWCSFTHIEHGLAFYFIGWLLFRQTDVMRQFLCALTVEVGGELLENTPQFIQLYREQALVAGYSGDSILNSISDAAFMMFGFLFAWLTPAWSAVLLAVVIELYLGYSIRDNLTLNIVNFMHSFDFVRDWQNSGRRIKNL